MQLPTLDNDEKAMLDSPIQLDEIRIAIKQMSIEKCPGLDGLNADFYKHFEEDIIHNLHSVILKAVKVKKFHASANQGILSLLDKHDKDLLSVGVPCDSTH